MGIGDHELDEPFDMIGYCSVHEWECSAWVGCMACMEDAADRAFDTLDRAFDTLQEEVP